MQPSVILDIETVARPWDSLAMSQQTSLLRRCESDEERAEIMGSLALWAPTGMVVAVGMMNIQSQNRMVAFLGSEECGRSGNGLLLRPFSTEVELIQFAWNTLALYGTVITFNGRGFDIPFLNLRSIAMSVPVTRKDLLGPRFSTKPHCDLLEQLTFYGLTRKFSLDFYCHAFGVQSPKGGGDGSKVGEMFRAGQVVEIAEYCAGDVLATERLYQRWAKIL